MKTSKSTDRKGNLITLKVIICLKCYDLGKIYTLDGNPPQDCGCDAGQKAKEAKTN